jgi:hypothetical protein
MKIGLCIAFLGCTCSAFAADCPKDQPRDASALLQIERTWAKALDAKDADAIGCILADEYEDADIHGALHNRGETLANIAQRDAPHNELSDMNPHVQGEAGYLRGVNTVTDAKGKPLAKVLFTDIFVYRDGRWQAVAGQETSLSEPSK